MRIHWWMLVNIVALSNGHVVLEFPPARYPPLDYLILGYDGPCGIPKNQYSPSTTFRAGEAYNVTWGMSFAHQGGYAIDLLDKLGTVVQKLTPETPSFVGLNDQTAQMAEITFPTLDCVNCSLRLTRQAVEFGGLTFVSCADVNVVANPPIPNQNCTGHGVLGVAGTRPICKCNSPFFGEFCQNHAICVSDADCLNGGTCMMPEPQWKRLNKCYCPPKFFGAHCEQEFKATIADLQSGCFNYEVSESTPSTQSLFEPKCYKQVTLNDANDKVYWRMMKDAGQNDVIEVVLVMHTDSWVSFGWKPQNLTATCYDFPIPVHRRGDYPLHPMDCSDLVVGSADKYRSQVGDYYTRDRSTPLPDDLYFGLNSLTAAYGANHNGITTLMFRKPAKSQDPADHSLHDEMVDVIWAKGMDPKNYMFFYPSGVSTGESKNKDYFPNNSLKYHGSQNRGSLSINFVTGEAYTTNGQVQPEPEPKPEGEPTGTPEAEPSPEPKAEPQTPHPEEGPKEEEVTVASTTSPFMYHEDTTPAPVTNQEEFNEGEKWVPPNGIGDNGKMHETQNGANTTLDPLELLGIGTFPYPDVDTWTQTESTTRPMVTEVTTQGTQTARSTGLLLLILTAGSFLIRKIC